MSKCDRSGYVRPQRELTYELAHQALIYDSNSGAFSWKHDRAKAKSGQQAGFSDSKGYHVIFVFGKRYQANRVAWLMHYGCWSSADHIDHINGVRDDNRIANLREATKSQNNQSKRLLSCNTSGARGVARTPQGKYQARMKLHGKYIYLGVHDTVDCAAHAYNKAAITNHGDFAVLNPIGSDK